MRRLATATALWGGVLTGSCQLAADGQPGPRQAAFAGIAAGETIRLIGTEPFWSGTVAGERFVYSTLDNQAGEAIAVKRFAGNSGLAFSGTRGGVPIDLMVTRGACSDGMSDRTYPYTATLRVGDEQRSGCVWTNRQPFTGPANP